MDSSVYTMYCTMYVQYIYVDFLKEQLAAWMGENDSAKKNLLSYL